MGSQPPPQEEPKVPNNPHTPDDPKGSSDSGPLRTRDGNIVQLNRAAPSADPLEKYGKSDDKYTDFFCPVLVDFGQNWSKIASPGPGRASKGFLDALGSILAKYQPKRSHGDPFQFNFDDFL